MDQTKSLEYGVPSALIAASVGAAMWLPDIFQLLIPVVALVCGIIARPRHTGIVWIASWLIYVVALSIVFLTGHEPPKAVDTPETAADYLVDAGIYLPYLAALALLPLWLGRRIGNGRRERSSSAA